MEAFADWDLLAVVRSCCTTTTNASSAAAAVDPPLPPKQVPCFPLPTPTPTPTPLSSTHDQLLFGFPTPFQPLNTSFFGGQQELQDICKPSFISTSSSSSSSTTAPVAAASSSSSCTVNSTNFQSLPSSSSSSLTSPISSSSSSVIAGGSFRIGEQPQLRRLIRPSQVVFGAPTPANSTSQAQRTKKRKNMMKKVSHVPAEGLSNDMWAWRKYGQKPIKGSPYPRGYYRCSSSKGCLARKQVERNRSDPKMFIVTYTAEHNHPMPTHRNSLAGSTRQKPIASAAGGSPSSAATVPDGTPQDQTKCSSPSPSAASLSPATEKSESKTEGDELMKEEEDNDMGISDLILNDDFYVGFEKIHGEDDAGESFPDHFSPSMEFPWLSNTTSTAATAGGI